MGRFKCPIKSTKGVNEGEFLEKVELLFGKDNCPIEIQGTVVWAYLGKFFYFQSPLTEEDLDTVNNCFAEGTQIVDSIEVPTAAPTETATNTPSAVPSAATPDTDAPTPGPVGCKEGQEELTFMTKIDKKIGHKSKITLTLWEWKKGKKKYKKVETLAKFRKKKDNTGDV